MGFSAASATPMHLPATGAPTANPSRADNGLVGMALFIATETMLFAGLMSAFWILRAGAEQWPPPGQPRLPIVLTGLNTLVLLLSAVTMQLAANESKNRSLEGAIRWLGWTGLLGALFLSVQGIEWVRLLRFGLHASASVYGSTFYTLVGCHGIHVLAAVIALFTVGRKLASGREPEHVHNTVQVCRLYWFFVVAIWPILYVLVYLS